MKPTLILMLIGSLKQYHDLISLVSNFSKLNSLVIAGVSICSVCNFLAKIKFKIIVIPVRKLEKTQKKSKANLKRVKELRKLVSDGFLTKKEFSLIKNEFYKMK